MRVQGSGRVPGWCGVKHTVDEFLVSVNYHISPDEPPVRGRTLIDMGIPCPNPPPTNAEMQTVASAAKRAMSRVLRDRARETLLRPPEAKLPEIVAAIPVEPELETMTTVQLSLAETPESASVSLPPPGYDDGSLSQYGVVWKDTWCGEPIGWGFIIVRQLSGERFNALGKYGSVECLEMGRWCLVTKWVTHADLVHKYGEVTEVMRGPNGGFKTITYGTTQFWDKHLNPNKTGAIVSPALEQYMPMKVRSR